MELRALIAADEGVSPVVGVVLLVGITLILAAGTATFALGFGQDQTGTPPQVSFEVEYTQAGNGNLSFTHEGGDTPDSGTLSITADRQFHPAPGNDSGSPSGSAYQTLGLDRNVDDGAGGTEQWVTDDLTAGTRVTIVGTSPSNNLEDATVRVVYSSESTDRTTTLVEWEGPQA